jgi:hypothetical protein
VRIRLRANQWLLLCLLLLAGGARAQSQAASSTGVNSDDGVERLAPIPVLTGGGAFEFSSESPDRTFHPDLSPILLVPLGSHGLFETEFEGESHLTWTDGKRQPAMLEKSLEYAQIDYFLPHNTTLVLGRFATPFGFYKERMDARWIRNLQMEPLMFGFSDNSNNGAEVRGNLPLAGPLQLNYIGYFSAFVNNPVVGSDRQSGFRTAVFNSKSRVEVGFSFQRKLNSGDRFNAYGADLNWNLRNLPVDLRSELLISGPAGKGYWAEAAWRLSRPGYPKWLKRSQAVLRGEQFFAPSAVSSDTDQITADRVMGGWNYQLTELFRLQGSIGRQFGSSDNHNIYAASLNFRFVR